MKDEGVGIIHPTITNHSLSNTNLHTKRTLTDWDLDTDRAVDLQN